MKKLLLASSASVVALAIAGSSSAQMIKDTRFQMKAGVGGSVGISLEGFTQKDAGPAATLVMPDFQNFIKVFADGQLTSLGLNFGAMLQLRPLKSFTDNTADGSPKAFKIGYLYFGHKSLGKVTLGKDYSVVVKNLIDGSNIVPGNSQSGEELAKSSPYRSDTIDIANSDANIKVSYETPNIYGLKLGYSYTPKAAAMAVTKTADKSGVNVQNAHDGSIRYDAAYGPLSFALNLGVRGADVAADQTKVGAFDDKGKATTALPINALGGKIFGYTTGAQIAYTDGQNVGVTLNGGFHHQTLYNSAANNQASAWSIGTAFTSPRLTGLTLGLVYGQGQQGVSTNNKNQGVTAQHFGVGLGYVWSENFSQTLSYDQVIGTKVDGQTAKNRDVGYWILNSQATF